MTRRKVVAASLVCAVLLVCAGAAAFAQAPVINVVAPGKVEITNELYGFAARELALKDGAEVGKSFKGKMPLMNLDLQFTSSDFAKTHVKVWIPLDFISKKTQASPAKAASSFSIWDGGEWVTGAAELKKLGVVNVRIEGRFLTFEVTQWPRDDRMIGC